MFAVAIIQTVVNGVKLDSLANVKDHVKGLEMKSY